MSDLDEESRVTPPCTCHCAVKALSGGHMVKIALSACTTHRADGSVVGHAPSVASPTDLEVPHTRAYHRTPNVSIGCQRDLSSPKDRLSLTRAIVTSAFMCSLVPMISIGKAHVASIRAASYHNNDSHLVEVIQAHWVRPTFIATTEQRLARMALLLSRVGWRSWSTVDATCIASFSSSTT